MRRRHAFSYSPDLALWPENAKGIVNKQVIFIQKI